MGVGVACGIYGAMAGDVVRWVCSTILVSVNRLSRLNDFCGQNKYCMMLYSDFNLSVTYILALYDDDALYYNMFHRTIRN